MNKKPFWKRINRGFVVSMALLAIVLIYIIVTQLMLIPEKNEINRLTGSLRELMERTTMLTDEQLESLKSESAVLAEQNRLKTELSGLFGKDSGYRNEAVSLLFENIRYQIDNIQRITKRNKVQKIENSIMIDQDIANLSAVYEYTVSGQSLDAATDTIREFSDQYQRLYLTVSFKKTGGEWKIYRISSAMWDLLNTGY